MSTWMNRLHGEKFIFFDLKSKDERRLVIISGLFGIGSCVAGVYANIFNLSNGALITGVVSTTIFFAKLVQRSRKLIDYEIDENPKLSDRIESSELSETLKKAGFEKLPTPVSHKGKCEYILRSMKVDAFLRAGGPVLEEITPSSKLQNRLEGHADILEKLLRCKIAESNSNKKQFINENKVTIFSDPINQTLRVTKGSYYRSYLTNDWTGLRLVTHGTRPFSIGDGLSWFPIEDKNTKVELLGIENAPLGNHLGVSTVAITRDGKLTLWRQSPFSQHSPGLLAPTGSGSADWDDFEIKSKPITLGELAKYAMERELTEESFGGKQLIGREHISDTLVLGYFRWLRRGGLPECVGVTRLKIDEHELSPNEREVDGHEDYSSLLCQPASNREELQEAVTNLIGHEKLSLPLYVTLKALLEALASEEPGLENLLFGKL